VKRWHIIISVDVDTDENQPSTEKIDELVREAVREGNFRIEQVKR